jgi:hypothetical protein
MKMLWRYLSYTVTQVDGLALLLADVRPAHCELSGTLPRQDVGVSMCV